MKVIVIGAGIGGLALAGGLLDRGFEVVVYERDRNLADTGGYHLHLHPRSLAALCRLLDPSTLEQVYGCAAAGEVDMTTAMRDHRGRLLTVTHGDEDGQSLNIDRVTLRLQLARPVTGALRCDMTFAGCATVPDGRVEARFEDGSTDRCDLLVGADGVRSRVARHLTGGEPTSSPVGLIGIGGFTPVASLSSHTATYLGSTNSNFAFGPAGSGLYIGYHDPVGAPVLDVRPADRPITRVPTYIWGVMLGAAASELLDLAGAELRTAVAAHLTAAGWSPRLTAVIEHADDHGLAAFGLHAADPKRLAPWPAGAITALGDAVHAVPPTGGQGAATAIMDADVLCRQLTAAVHGEKTPAMAVNDFHLEMRSYAAVAVAESLKPVAWMRRASTPVGVAGLRMVSLLSSARRGYRR